MRDITRHRLVALTTDQQRERPTPEAGATERASSNNEDRNHEFKGAIYGKLQSRNVKDGSNTLQRGEPQAALHLYVLHLTLQPARTLCRACHAPLSEQGRCPLP